MNELTQLVPKDIDFSILGSLFGATSIPPFLEIVFVYCAIVSPIIGIWLHNKSAWKSHGWLNLFGQSACRVFLDVALVVGICGSSIGVVAIVIGGRR